MNNKWNFPGSKWWKFDFHIHTPASDDYGREDKKLKFLIDPEDWIRNAMESGLDCVVITDHNSGGWIDDLKAKNKELQDREIKPEWYKKLTIFPGVEITVADSNGRVHLLALFDPNCDSRKVTGVLGACGISENYGDEQKTSTTAGFCDTVRKINEAYGIAIPAHIDCSSGLLEDISSLTPELEKNLKLVTAVEICDLHKFDKADSALRTSVNQLAKVAGSDAHKPEEIGRFFSWIKMSRPSIEGLRLALSDYEFCVKNQDEDPNYLSDIFLSQLIIRNMRHCGRVDGHPFVMRFHPHFNSIIGGRGTGKSTILESIRIAARRDQNLAAEAPLIKCELEKFMNLSQNKGVMLNDTEILLEIKRRRNNYRLRWRLDGEGGVLEEESENGWQTAETGDIKERFPISIFSQKQINELASNPKGLLEIIDRSPEVNRVEWKSSWDGVKSQFLQLRERRRELLRQLAEEQVIRVKLGDVENDLKQYEEKGHGEVLLQYQKRIQQRNGLPDDQILDDLSSGIRILASSAELSHFPAHLFDEYDETIAEIKAIHEQTALDLKKICEILCKIAGDVDALKVQRAEKMATSRWFLALQKSIVAYDGLVREYEEKKSQLSISLYGEWVQERNRLHQKLKRLNSVRSETEMVEKKIDDCLEKLQELRAELLTKRRAFLKKVIGGSSFVRMELVQYGDVNTLEDEYRSLLNLEDGKFLGSVYDRDGKKGILWELCNWEEEKILESCLPQNIADIKSKTFAIAGGQESGNHGSFDNRLKKLLETQPAVFDQLDSWWPEDMLRVKYSKTPSSGKFEDLEKGSAGQKAAAILAFLLSHGDEPLVIDQPEDDLDNALIYDLIVKQIHENKNRRQIVIVTHNPNIVVNGDSELVHVLKFENGQVQINKQGGLEESSIRDAICTIMEGGRQAFDKRYKRITLEV